MFEPIRLSFDLPTSVNQMYRRTRFTVVLSNDAMAYKLYAQAIARHQYEFKKPLKEDVAIVYRFYGSRLDIDNGLKLLNDAMNGIIYIDDKQIKEIHVYIINRKDDDPRVELEVSAIVPNMVK